MKSKPIRYEKENERLSKVEEKISEKEAAIREKATLKGQAMAARLTRRADPLFKKLGLKIDDSKMILHPVDFLVFDGMNSKDETRRLVFVDEKASRDRLRLQRSIEKTVEKERYEWQTLHIDEKGIVSEKTYKNSKKDES